MPAVEISLDQLAKILEPLGGFTRATKLTGGMFATTFKAELNDGRTVVVKSAPADTSSVLSYEHNIIGTERDVYRLAQGKSALLMPQIIHTDFSRTHVDGDVVVASFLSGTPWNELNDAGTVAHDDPTVDRQRGAFFARLNTITGQRFGYPSAEHLQADSWREAFGLALDALLDDAARWDVQVPFQQVRAAFERHAHCLDAVMVPHLVHMDLWLGNAFIEPDGTLSGVIGTERACYGDPLFDFVGADQIGQGPIPRALAQGYEDQAAALVRAAASGEPIPGLGPVDEDVAREIAGIRVPRDLPVGGELTGEHARVLLYRMYFYLLLIIEVKPRAYTDDWVPAHVQKISAKLDAGLDTLLA